MKSLSTVLAVALAGTAEAGLRFGCSTLTIQRLDPVVEPGNAPSAHLHHIVGGNAFNATMTGDVGARGTCTTCQMAEDFSNYWTAVMYFKHPANGSYHRVPVVNNAALAQGTTGGITVYYTQFDLTRDNIKQQPITAFKPGFRMTVGSPTHTGKPHAGLSYNCLTTLINRGPELSDFPTKPCPAGIFVTHHFPACWDGKNLDSPDHQSHMYNTDTTKFNNLWSQKDGNPFRWSFEASGSDGSGTHADYMFGWKGDSLQKAMDKSECFYDGCGSIKQQTMSVANQCKVKNYVNENIDGWVSEMPGMGSPMM
ncbi:hypothetical protein GE09DRAFT_1105261 [Coniochaeta sp. 2T2.1]|nr:hypothetical protein GE09DRAFT_1105261 [Coniochaeta sp. 2T2.1]